MESEFSGSLGPFTFLNFLANHPLLEDCHIRYLEEDVPNDSETDTESGSPASNLVIPHGIHLPQLRSMTMDWESKCSPLSILPTLLRTLRTPSLVDLTFWLADPYTDGVNLLSGVTHWLQASHPPLTYLQIGTGSEAGIPPKDDLLNLLRPLSILKHLEIS